MPIDGCPHDFTTLATTVLPARMAQLRLRLVDPIAMAEFDVDGDGPVTLAQRHGFSGDISGCYVLLESSVPVYVGISRHVFERLRQHVRGGDHLTATLAYRMAAADTPHDTFAATAMAGPDFRAAFDARRAYLRGLDVAIVKIDDPLELYLFEVYAAVELDTSSWTPTRRPPNNEFEPTRFARGSTHRR